MAEGNSGTTNAAFAVTLSKASTGAVTVNYATANGTATAGSDYTSTIGALTFSPGQTTKMVSVPVIGDTAVEPTETFYLSLSNPVGAVLGDGQGTGTITNDDSVPSSLRVGDATVSEGNSGTKSLMFTIALSPASAGTVSVKYATANGTATAGSDYTAAAGTLTYAAGQTSKTLSITVRATPPPRPTRPSS